ncbi:aspartyl/glutamyl-tRNA amidotransferase subunit B, partial [Patescibacteria group bacterium]|nr:aspartyl/glutamyl-tRNA amidotransferase subunit B [Patescibacteria group bacterium]
MKYEPTIGLEIHAELKTKSKMFCACVNGLGLEKEPNINICPVCTGQPGVLPVINEEAVHMVLKAGLALGGQIGDTSKFDRKNYFYPDLPKGYQISQYDKPLVEGGYLDVGEDGEKSRVRITRIHLEEDTGKLMHPKGTNYSLVDLNRAGVPLMELVTEPDIKSGSQARKFCQELQLIFRYLGISDADMERGQMRCEVNISLRTTDYGLQSKNNPTLPPFNLRGGEEGLKIDAKLSVAPLGTKVEIKNLNSFRVVEKAIDYEIKRQAEALDGGEKIIQETRGWDDAIGETFSQRVKEEAHDYRYFPEPDLPPLSGLVALSEELKKEIPELPNQRRVRFIKEYNLSAADAETFVVNFELGNYFEKVVSEIKSWAKPAQPPIDPAKAVKLAVNYLITELQKLIYQSGAALAEIKITPENFAEFIKLVAQGVVSSSGAQAVLAEMFATGADPSHIIKEKDLGQVSDEEELNAAVLEVISQNPGPVADYKKGKQNSLMFLVGKVMA